MATASALPDAGRDDPDLVGRVQPVEAEREPHRRRLGRVSDSDHRSRFVIDAGMFGEQRAAVTVRADAQQHDIEVRDFADIVRPPGVCKPRRVPRNGRVEVLAELTVRSRHPVDSRSGERVVATRAPSAPRGHCGPRSRPERSARPPRTRPPDPVDALGGERGCRGRSPDLLHDRPCGQRQRGAAAVILSRSPAPRRAGRRHRRRGRRHSAGQRSRVPSPRQPSWAARAGRARCGSAPRRAR